MRTEPEVTVGIPLYQGVKTIAKAVRSALVQHCCDIEVLIVDDGSSDGSVEEVRRIRDPRIRLVRNSQNLGLAFTRNLLVEEARGRYLAWLDQDDLALPGRLALQRSRFGARSNLVLSSGWCIERRPISGTTPETSLSLRYRSVKVTVPTNEKYVRVGQGFNNLFITSSCMVDLKTIRDNGLQFENHLFPAEDYDFWNRLMEFGQFEILPKYLCEREISFAAASASARMDQIRLASEIGGRYLVRNFSFYSHAKDSVGYEILCFRPSGLQSKRDARSVWSFVGNALQETRTTQAGDFKVFGFFLSALLQRLIRRHGLLRYGVSPLVYMTLWDISTLIFTFPKVVLGKLMRELPPR